jgi:4-amino-4-deoxy-L-arabinose transferase-like glycosyltransferase
MSRLPPEASSSGGSARGRVAIFLVLAAILALGVVPRVHGLGSRQLAADEYFFISSVDHLLDTGLPRFPTGGYYTRGLLPQYLTAGSILAFGDNGLAYRLPSVLFGLATILLAYLYARQCLPVILALAVSLMLAVSSWEVEFSRFARMYSPFQFVTLLFLISLHRAYVLQKERWLYVPHVLVAVAALTHELGVLLAPLLFLPFLFRTDRQGPLADWRWIRFGLVSSLTAAAVVTFTLFDFWNLGVRDPFPAGYVYPSSAQFRVGAFPFWRVSEDPFVNVVAVLALLVGTCTVFWLRRQTGKKYAPRDLLLWLLAVSAASHQFAIAGVFLGVLILRYGLPAPRKLSRNGRVAMGMAVLSGLAWLVLAAATSDWVARVAPGDLPRSFRQTFLGFPDFYNPIVVAWRLDLPVLGLLAALAFLYQIVTRLQDPLLGLARNPAAVLVYVAILFGILKSHYLVTRYFYFIYPVILTVIALSAYHLVTRVQPGRAAIGGVLLCLACFAATEDFQPAHLAGVDREEVAFRIGPYSRFHLVWYERVDFQSPAEFLNTGAAAGDAIVLVGQDPVSRFLKRSHANYVRREGTAYTVLSRRRGEVHVWSGRPLLDIPEELRLYTTSVRTVWLVRSTDPARKVFVPEQVWSDRLRAETREFVGRDGRLEVVKVSLRPLPRR